MTLPKMLHPTFPLTIPSTKKVVKFRPFLVKEEKILLMAKVSKDMSDILGAIKQIVNNCAVDRGFDINKLTVFDMEYLFLKIRSSSIGNIVPLAFKDNEDGKEYKFEVDLNTVEVMFPATNDPDIKITDKLGIKMKYPSATMYDDKNFLSMGQEAMFELIIRCVDKIYDENGMYEAKAYSKEDIGTFIEELDVKSFEKIQDYLNNTPKLYHLISYENEKGTARKIELTTLSDFFTLR